MFDKMRAFLDMQKNMQELKRELENTSFEVQSPDGLVKIIMTGSQEVKEVIIGPELKGQEKAGLEKAIKDAYNMAVKRSHGIAAGKMKGITGLNFPGMP